MEKAVFYFSLLLNAVFLYQSSIKMLQLLCEKGKAKVRKIFKNYTNPLPKNEAQVYIAREKEVSFISGKVATERKELPDHLIIKPGKYTFYGKSYDLFQEGVYRFVFPEVENKQRIVFTGDVAMLMASLTWLITHGEEDDYLSHCQLMKKAKSEKLLLTCESAARFCRELLTELNIPCRLIGTRTLENWNTYDDGHYLLEVYRHDIKKWVLYDIDTDAYFTYADQPLSLMELTRHLHDDYQINFISNDIKVLSNRHHYSFVFIDEAKLANLKYWYKRIMQFTFIEQDKDNYSFHDWNNENTKQYPLGGFPSIISLEPSSFVQKFYPQGAL